MNGFSKNVFINYPFDKDYITLIKPLVFTLIYLEFKPQISKTISSGNIRVNEIQKLIKISKFSIHDLSRSRPTKENGIPRFNMPFELGLDIGCKYYGGSPFSKKRFIVLEKTRHYYKKVLSDISGQDIKSHNNNPKILISRIRDWFSDNDGRKNLPGGSEIWIVYNQFISDLYLKLKDKSYSDKDIREIPIGDFIKFARIWIRTFKLNM